MKIGVLALQGGFTAHLRALKKLGTSVCEVKTSNELSSCDGLILPGGESTTITTLLREENLLEPLREFAKFHPLFGTCAGMIIMAKEGWLDIAVQRNAYGRQTASFTTLLTTSENVQLKAIFIRAPRITALLSNRVDPLAFFQSDPVIVKQGLHLATSFHPELTDDLWAHQLFLQQCINSRR